MEISRGELLAYFLTFTCYGSWLHGDERGSVDVRHNQPGTPFLPPDHDLEGARRAFQEATAYRLDQPRRRLVLQAIREVCVHRTWQLLAAHVRPTHVHIVVQAPGSPERALNDFKAHASRILNAAGLDPAGQKRWARHGSTRYLWSQESLEAAIYYTLQDQGEPMEVFGEEGADPPHPSRARK